MGSWLSRSEEALATLVCQRLDTRAGRVLIGGLGMGFTLRAALDVLPQTAKIVVAELVPKIITWANGPLAHIFGDCLDDPRVSIELGDVHDIIMEQCGGFDAILLDVDNGPDGLINVANERLYCNWGLRAAHASLRPGGTLAIWSAYPDDLFLARLSSASFDVEEATIDTGEGDHRSNHTIWLARKLD